MADNAPTAAARRGGQLTSRVVVGVALIAAAVAAELAGGIVFTALVALAVLLMFAEWTQMHRIGRGWRLAGLVLLAAVCLATFSGEALLAVAGLAGGAGLLGLGGRPYLRQRAFWLASGLLYCGLPAIALIWLRAQPNGLAWTVWTLAIVWATDIMAYFAGRTIGGPKLAPRISPNKTWAGLGGGMLGAALVSSVTAVVLGLSAAMIGTAALLGGLLAVVAQGGDLFESWLKRRAGVKDSGSLLAGHGGVLDRLDGLVPVAVVVALVVAMARMGA